MLLSDPVGWDGVRKIGALGLLFPLHLLLATLASALLTFVAWRYGSKLVAGAFGLVGVLTTVAALTPVLAIWQQARALSVQLSLEDYLANATHINVGGPRQDRSVIYGIAKDGSKLKLDVWRTGRPHTDPLRPAIVFVHGGAWNYGSRGERPDWNRWLNELGYEVFDVEYRMPPPVRWLDEIGDVKSALGWVVAHAAEYHVDPTRISVMGGSAGANLSMLAAYSSGGSKLLPSTDVPAVMVRSVINLYGPTDMALLYDLCMSPDCSRQHIKSYIGGTPEEFPDRYRELSPLSHVTDKAPPTITFLGTWDRMVAVEHAERLDQALAKAGVPHEMYLLPANRHSFDLNWGGFGTQIARSKIEQFLKRYDGH